MNNTFTLTWNTTKDQDEPLGTDEPIFTFLGDRKACFYLHMTLTKAGYSFVTMRNLLGQVVDMNKGILATGIVGSNCLLDFDKIKLEEVRQNKELSELIKLKEI